MARKKQSVIYLDTHIVVWLYAGLVEKLTDTAKKAINEYDITISQFVRLELQYLFEIGRIKTKPSTIIKSLSQAINLEVSDHPLEQIVGEALNINWTRDLFDRLLVAEARSSGCSLISADRQIRSSFKQTVW